MPQAAEDLLAIPDKRATQLAGISMRQLRYWEEVNLVVPSMRHRFSARNVVRLYTHPDLVEYLVAAQLRNDFSLQHIRRVVNHLRRNYAAPLRELRFAKAGDRIYFQHPDGSWEGDLAPDQTILSRVIDLDVVRALISRATERAPEAVGRIVKKRGVHSSEPIFAGTRIRVSTVQSYLRHGYDTDTILRSFPSLDAADVKAARQKLAS